jgi:hypothetical protein
MKKLLITISYIFGFVALLHSQQESIQRLGIQSPEIAAFERLVEIPVDIYTGVPKISIPIYTVKSGDVELPISLDYHAVAVKVDQEASWVGLNWILNAGGVVSTQRTSTYAHPSVTDEDWQYLYSRNSFSVGYDPDIDQTYYLSGLHGGMPSNYGYNLFECENRDYDISPELSERLIKRQGGESQLFRANFANKSFKFVYHRLQNSFIVVGKDEKVKISGGTSCFDCDAYISKITDANGVKYYFTETEVNSTSYNNYAPVAVAHYLTGVTSPSGSTITLSYKKYDGIQRLATVSQQIYNGYQGKCSNCVEINITYTPTIYNSYLYEIKSDNIVVRFNVGDRIDMRGNPKKLESICIYRKESDNSETLIKTIRFNYEYFKHNTNGGNMIYDMYSPNYLPQYNQAYNDDVIYKRLKLTSIQEEVIDEQGQTKTLPSYLFSYSGTLPAKSSAAVDYWGFYNGQENESNHPETGHFSGRAIGHILIPNPTEIEENSTNAHPSELINMAWANRKFNPNTVSSGMLSRITYPTGTFTNFSFEPHEFTNYRYTDINISDTGAPKEEILGYIYYSDVNASWPEERHTPKEFWIYSEADATVKIHFQKSFALSWKDMLGAKASLFVYPNATELNGNYTLHSQWKLAEIDTVNKGNNIELIETLALPAGKYRIEAFHSVPQTDPLTDPNFRGETYVHIIVSATQTPSNITRYKGGGVRIKEIKQNLTTTEYKYNYEDGSTSGILMSPVRYARLKSAILQDSEIFNDPKTGHHPPTTAKTFTYWLQGSYNMVPAYENKMGYGRVEVHTTGSSQKNGKTIYEHWNKKYIPYSDFFRPLEDPRNGNILKESVYDIFGKLIKETKNTYQILNKESFLINTVAEDIYEGPNVPCSTISYFPRNLYANACPTGRMLLYSYCSTKYWIELTARTEKLFAGNDSLISNTTYAYNPSNLFLASVQRKLYSNNEYDMTYFTYPTDYKYTGENYPAKLVSKNIVNVPIEMVKGIKKGNDMVITSGIVNKYDEYGNLIENLSLDIKEPLAFGSFKFSNKSKKGILPNSTTDSTSYALHSDYVSKATCTYEDCNPVYINKKESDKIVYLWGYRKQYPVAKIEGVTYDQIKAALGQTLINRVANAATFSGADSTTVNNLRKTLPTAQVTTYTYIPLVGMRTATDPRGVKTSYFYDVFGRLQAVKDENGKTIETNEYHYGNQ